MDEDVILVKEQRTFIDKINYAIWPGDQKKEAGEEPVVTNKRKRDDQDQEEDTNAAENLSKRACMSNRYFSYENALKLREETSVAVVAATRTTENEDFVRRRDYLMSKLLQSRTLPGEAAASSAAPNPSPLTKPANESAPAPVFMADFIPIGSKPEPPEHGSRLTPYPSDSLKRAADHFNYLFSDNSPFAKYASNQEMRTFDIVKLKLGLKSKFSNDPAMIRRFERESAAARRVIEDRERAVDAKLIRQGLSKPAQHTLIDLCSSEDEKDNRASSSKSRKESTDEDERLELMNLIAREDLVKLDDDDESSSSESRTEDEAEDSKCRQFGKYSISKCGPKTSKQANGSSRVRMNLSKVQQKREEDSSKGAKNLDIEQLQSKYTNLRNRKMKLRKKRAAGGRGSGLEVEVERKVLNAEMRQIRKSMRKMKRQPTNPTNNQVVHLSSNSSNSDRKSKSSAPSPYLNKPSIKKSSTKKEKLFRIVRKPKKFSKFKKARFF